MLIIKKFLTVFNKLKENYYMNDLRKRNNIFLGKDVFIDKDSVIKNKKLIIGDKTLINGPITITGGQLVQIGKYCAMGYHITIISTNHKDYYPNLQIAFQQKYHLQSLIGNKGPIIIGNNVWVGDCAIILPGVRIGDGVIIGAGSVITHDIPAYSVVVGVPGKVIKKRFSDEIIKELRNIKWWDWSEQQIKKNKKFFKCDLRNITVNEIKKICLEYK